MSNSNKFWGKRFGSVYKDGTLAFKLTRQGVPDNGRNVKATPCQNVPQSKRDREAFQIRMKTIGLPVMVHGKGSKPGNYNQGRNCI